MRYRRVLIKHTSAAGCVLVGASAWTPLLAQDASRDMGDNLRARAWATIVSIRDESIHTLEWHDVVTVHRDGAPDIVMARYAVRADDLRRLRVIGEQCLVTPDGVHRSPLIFSLDGGVIRAQNLEQGVGIVRPESPDLIWPWCVPSPLKGLGQLPSVKEIQSRAERLSQLEGLEIIEENGDAVILGGIEEHMGRSFQVRVSVDPRTGCTLRHQFIDPRWGTVVVDWSIPEWEQHADVFVPIRVEYRVLDAAIAPADQAAIRQAMEAAGLESECSDPRSPRYNDWVEFRDRFFRLHGAPMAHAEKWQSCTTTLVAVNQDFAQDWLELPAAPSIDVIMSSALDCEVDQWDLAPNR